jgi:HEAT repeat protein
VSRLFERNPAAQPPHPSHREIEAASLAELVGFLDDARAGVRADAACALGDRLRTRELEELDATALAKLADLLDDAEVMVRFEAAIALAEAHDPRATPLLVAAVRSRAARLDAIRALGTLGDAAAIEPLNALFRRFLLPWADRLQAAAALCALGDAGGAQYLESKLISRKPAERAAAIHFLAEARHPEARTLLEQLIADAADPMRDTAVRALGLLRDPASRAALERARASADSELRADIDEALRHLVE